MDEVEVDRSYGEGGILHKFLGRSQNTVEDVATFRDGVDKDVSSSYSLSERIDAMGVPESLVTVGGVGVDLDFDVGKRMFLYFRVDFNVSQITLANGNHRECVAAYIDYHAGKFQVGVQLFGEPSAVMLLIELLNGYSV